ncbi:MAG: hypothetical protein WBI34_03570 [Tenuifilaceae bacterium]|nr:hypothetical protein [Bacteroidales bacterium]NLH57710.1 hypothetical protein [Rikenellaceae bacterium]HOF90712.1 hypothetical protein [Tenuifilaceae bacterium]HOQ34109.1 hypothetical protein [Tenuifilaceae bacterium]HPI70895.1 hypothetical protein [Tenuifilaceae bacterium]
MECFPHQLLTARFYVLPDDGKYFPLSPFTFYLFTLLGRWKVLPTSRNLPSWRSYMEAFKN